jgi:LysM repeat protein/lipoprotein-anchoring transpeptidase ErfK/SrfK
MPVASNHTGPAPAQGTWASRPHRSHPVGGTPTLLEARASRRLPLPISYLLSSIFSLIFLIPTFLEANQQRPEPGLERAVNWKWSVVPSPPSQPWRLPPQRVPVLANPTATAPATPTADPGIYTIKKGDVLVRIAKRFDLTVAQLREFNALQSDFLQIGQELRIPNAEERLTLRSTGSKKTEQPAAQPNLVNEVLLLRVFLDNQGFSTGAISDQADPVFGRVLNLYQTGRGETLDHAAVVSQAIASTAKTLTDYTLRVEDFHFIAPPKATLATPDGKPAAAPRLTYEELLSPPILAYRSSWEFVAERFHCDEKFLRKLNPKLGANPPAGSIFRVPNVAPLEIEKIPARAIQPSAELAGSTRAVIRDLAVLEIYRDEKLTAVMPLSRSRPGLRGRGEWKILDAIPRPRLATIREPHVVREEKTGPFYVNPNPTPRQAPAVLEREEILPAGPNNPAGVVWINLAKANENTPLPFGLHGTATPSEMFGYESLGGFRLANWDILRAASLLPPGSKLEWLP